ncbi:DsrE family protein [sulfur-oxidizing endosymbiont of Gigantopelta aegis]|uniref:DsrE family protein n=1 Tax=sulfur-oxidizing endosymbiont of Gigantopelta aegis TaxID=2794934 RepID=UPI0018DDAF6A|nr:DsrE family protein [sulfur-oxidizing endosymbiont of Gigantopelta aegis]
MADKLLIIMVNTDPNNGTELGAPFFQATVAAAMEYEVEVILTGRSGELAVRGVAEKLFIKPDSKQTVYDYIREAYEAGVKFKVCTPTLDLWGDDLIPEVSETIGGAYVISEAMDDNTVTFTYLITHKAPPYFDNYTIIIL